MSEHSLSVSRWAVMLWVDTGMCYPRADGHERRKMLITWCTEETKELALREMANVMQSQSRQLYGAAVVEHDRQNDTEYVRSMTQWSQLALPLDSERRV